MKVLFRVDSGSDIGVGHVSRCLTLARGLARGGAEIHFVCRTHAGAALDWIRAAGFRLHALPVCPTRTDAGPYAAWLGADWVQDSRETLDVLHTCGAPFDWVVIDHYAIGRKWSLRLREATARIMVIDDLADRPHDCDLLLDQNLREGNPYTEQVPQGTRLLIGPRHALLREAFADIHRSIAARSGIVRRINVFFGGSDPTGETFKALDVLAVMDRDDIVADVVVGAGNPRRREVARRCEDLRQARFHCQVDDMATLFAEADLALGAAGVASWERMAVGLPALIVSVAENQVENMRQLARNGVACALGVSRNVTALDIRIALESLMVEPWRVRAMSEAALACVDGAGTARVIEAMADER